MTHKSLFKEAAQHYVLRGQLSDVSSESVGQPDASAPDSYRNSGSQMNAMAFGSSPQPSRPPAGNRSDQ